MNYTAAAAKGYKQMIYQGLTDCLCMPLCSIQALLSAPNPDDPLAENVAKHWKDNEQEAVATGTLTSTQWKPSGDLDRNRPQEIARLALLSHPCWFGKSTRHLFCKSGDSTAFVGLLQRY